MPLPICWKRSVSVINRRGDEGMRKLRSGVPILLVIMLALTMVLSACSKTNEGGKVNNTPPATTNSTKEDPKPDNKEKEPEPAEITKIKVTLWDRGITPAGAASLKDNRMVKWINEQLAPLGVEVEYMQIPRAEESEKLQVWMASGDAPDLIITYSMEILNRYAEMGGLRELDALLDEHGPQLKENNKIALEQAGTYKGVRYAIPALRGNPFNGSNMSIRKDWLDKLDMKVPTTTDELTEVLRAFKEKDPGGVGSANVVPWGLPALSGSGQSTFLFGAMAGFGIRMEGPQTESNYWQSGNIVNGEFVPSVLMPEGREYFRWMNQLFKEGLISKEFATDANSQRYTQDFNNGVVGFIDANNPAPFHNIQVRKTVAEATYVTVDPFVDPNGEQFFNKIADYGMFIMVPKTSTDKEAAAVVKYLNWMVQPDVLVTLNKGIEGEHWHNVDGIMTPIDPEANKQDLWVYGYGDLEIIQQGLKPTMDLEALTKEAAANVDLETPEKRREYAEGTLAFSDMVAKFGKVPPIINVPRPVNDRIGANLGKFLGEAVSKVIIAADFDKEYDALLKGWSGNGGDEWQKEATEVLKEIGYIK
ncbi:extracellular solute-binding protein [Paenibacillaceae bacterium]|nr:extracellular solute-binding protein [Paenibacillaceae bacterium]